MTSWTANTWRTRFNSLRVSFCKKLLHLSAKREGSGWRQQRRWHVVCFSQNKGETKTSNQWCQSRNCLIAFLFIPVLKTPTSSEWYSAWPVCAFHDNFEFCSSTSAFYYYFSGTHILFLCGLLTRKNFSSIIPHIFSFLSRSLRLEPRRLKFSLDHVFSVLRELSA